MDDNLLREKIINPVVLLVVDGLGIAPKNLGGSLLEKTETPFLDKLLSTYPVWALESPFVDYGKLSLARCYEISYVNMGAGSNLKKKILSSKDPLCLSKVLSENNILQCKICDVYGLSFVTYFLNGKKFYPFSNEQWELCSTPLGMEHSNIPEMALPKIYKVFSGALDEKTNQFYVIHVSNFQSIGFSGNFDALYKSVEEVDLFIGKIFSKTLEFDGAVLLASTHGFIESVYDMQLEKVITTPNQNPVPFIVAGKEYEGRRAEVGDMIGGDWSLLPISGALEDIAPTILKLLKINKPEWMKGESLIH